MLAGEAANDTSITPRAQADAVAPYPDAHRATLAKDPRSLRRAFRPSICLAKDPDRRAGLRTPRPSPRAAGRRRSLRAPTRRRRGTSCRHELQDRRRGGVNHYLLALSANYARRPSPRQIACNDHGRPRPEARRARAESGRGSPPRVATLGPMDVLADRTLTSRRSLACLTQLRSARRSSARLRRSPPWSSPRSARARAPAAVHARAALELRAAFTAPP